MTHSPKRNANGMLALPEAEMIAEETNGPKNADDLPTYSSVDNQFGIQNMIGDSRRTTENRAKNRNLRCGVNL